jgi:ribosomal protein L37AE/L43A
VKEVEITNRQLANIEANKAMQFVCPECKHNEITKAWNYIHNYCPHCGAKVKWNLSL